MNLFNKMRIIADNKAFKVISAFLALFVFTTSLTLFISITLMKIAIFQMFIFSNTIEYIVLIKLLSISSFSLLLLITSAYYLKRFL